MLIYYFFPPKRFSKLSPNSIRKHCSSCLNYFVWIYCIYVNHISFSQLYLILFIHLFFIAAWCSCLVRVKTIAGLLTHAIPICDTQQLLFVLNIGGVVLYTVWGVFAEYWQIFLTRFDILNVLLSNTFNGICIFLILFGLKSVSRLCWDIPKLMEGFWSRIDR